jgi:hypothetical protein
MEAGLHQGSGADLGVEPILLNVDNLLQLRVIEEEAVIGSIATADETGLKVFNVKAADSLCAPVDSAVEDYRGFFLGREQSVDLLVQT